MCHLVDQSIESVHRRNRLHPRQLRLVFLTLGLNERFARAQAIKIAVLVWAEESLIETLGITEQEVVDVRQMTIDEIRRHKEITKTLGWK